MTVVPPRNLQAGGEPLHVPLEGPGVGLVDVVDVEDEPPLRRREQTEVAEVGVTAQLDGQPGARALREVCGDAALYGTTADELAGHLMALSGDAALREAQSAAGRARAAEFSWERCAADHLRAYTLACG